MNRSWMFLTVSVSLVSCTASAPKASPSWWQSLDDTEAPIEDPSVSCRGVRASDELDRLANCWAPDAPPLTPMDVAGLEPMRIELRECLLAGLPAPKAAGENQAPCQQNLAEVLDRRLYQLGWLRAEVTPSLSIQLGQRYRIGELFVATGPSQRVNSKKIIKRAQKAIPKPRWCTQAALEEIHSRVFDTSKFEQVRVVLGEPDDRAGRVPVVITIQE